jgi:hypothetical protein
MSKSDFADLIFADAEYAKEFDFSAFQEIFRVIKAVIDSETK